MTKHNMTPRLPDSRPLAWTDAVLDIQDTLFDIPINDELYIVGGAVRDAYLRRRIKDLDFATSGRAISLARHMADALNADVFVLDDERDVARVLVKRPDGQLTIDVAHFRGDDLLSDLRGRDFTINAIACDFKGDLSQWIDPLNGEADLKAKQVRRCTENSLADDPLRALRAVRQSVQLAFRIEAQTLADIRAQVPNLTQTSGERIRDEFFAWLGLEKVSQAMRVGFALGLMQEIMPQLADLNRLSLPEPHTYTGWQHALEAVKSISNIITTISYQRTDNTAANFGMGIMAMQFDRFRQQLNAHIFYEWANGRSHAAILRLGALLHTTQHIGDNTLITEQLVSDIRLSNPERKRLIGMQRAYHRAQTIDHTNVLYIHRYWHTLEEIGVDAILLGLANYLSTVGTEFDQDTWIETIERAVVLLDAYFNQYETIVAPPMFVNGNDLIEELSLEPSPLLGEILTAIREAQVTGEVTSREDALQLAQEFVASHE